MLLKIFSIFVLISFCTVNAEFKEWFKNKNADAVVKLIEVKIQRIYNNERRAILDVVYELKENGNSNKFEDVTDQEYGILNFTNLRIEQIEPGAFKTLHNFTRFYLTGNELREIKNGVFNNIRDLNKIDLSYNKISVIEDGTFDDMPEVNTISLYRNRIVELNENWFKNSPDLTSIDFEHNKIDEIKADNFKNLGGVHKVIGLIQQVGINLDFSNNRIFKIHPNAFKGIPLIDSLRLRENKLKELPENLFKGIIVEDLDLGLNNIPCTPKEVFNATKSYNSNPPVCP